MSLQTLGLNQDYLEGKLAGTRVITSLFGRVILQTLTLLQSVLEGELADLGLRQTGQGLLLRPRQVLIL